MNDFLNKWGEAAYTSVGFFWMALWAFAFGYLVSSMIQVLITQERMKRSMGGEGPKQVGLAAVFGFISSSCSFAALATTKSLFKKGAGFVPSIAFLLASTNLVIELGVVIAVFLTWQFVVGEYLGGLLLIGCSWLFIRLTRPKEMIENARERLGDDGNDEDKDIPNWKERIQEYDAWKKIGKRYKMEWGMVWKDVTVGFTIAGIVAIFIPTTFYETLFIGTGSAGDGGYSFFQILEHTLVGPVMAFITFIGSMGNIPLAAVLFDNGVSFAGVMAFIFSDLVVLPVLRINAKYYGWKMALYILLTLFVSLVATTILLHYGFSLTGLLPQGGGGGGITDRQFFQLDYSFWLNIGFILASGVLAWLSTKKIQDDSLKGMHEMPDKGWVETVLFWLAMASYVWLAVGLVLKFVVNG